MADPGNRSSDNQFINMKAVSFSNHKSPKSIASKKPNKTPAETSRMWCLYRSNRDKATLVDQAKIGGQKKYETGSSIVKKNNRREALDAWPDGKLLGKMKISR